MIHLLSELNTTLQILAYKLTKFVNVDHNLIGKVSTCQLREKLPPRNGKEKKIHQSAS